MPDKRSPLKEKHIFIICSTSGLSCKIASSKNQNLELAPTNLMTVIKTDTRVAQESQGGDSKRPTVLREWHTLYAMQTLSFWESGTVFCRTGWRRQSATKMKAQHQNKFLIFYERLFSWIPCMLWKKARSTQTSSATVTAASFQHFTTVESSKNDVSGGQTWKKYISKEKNTLTSKPRENGLWKILFSLWMYISKRSIAKHVLCMEEARGK